jgi:hypothetical protein
MSFCAGTPTADSSFRGVAEQAADLIRSIVFLDAFLPNNGDAIEGITGRRGRRRRSE